MARDCKMHLATLERIGGRKECLAGAEKLRETGACVTALSQGTQFDPLAVFRLRRLVRRWLPDVIHAWQPHAQTLLGLAGNRDWPVVATIDSWRSDQSSWNQCWQQRALFRAKKVVVPFTEMATELAPFDLVPDRVVVIPPGVHWEASDASATTVSRRTLLATVGLPPEARLIAAAGRITTGRGYRDCIWCEDILSLLFPDSYLLIFGDGPQRCETEAFNRAMRGWAHTRFVGWRDLGPWWPHIELFFHADREPGISMALLEALAAGKPVVASDTPSHRLFLTDGNNASLAAVDDRTSLAKCGRRVLRDPLLAQRLSEAGRRTVHERFSLDPFLATYGNLYANVACSTAPHSRLIASP